MNRHKTNTIFRRLGDIGIFIIGNPPQNYITDPVFIDPEFLLKTISDDTLKALIFTGEGRHFSAGADVESLFSQERSSDLKDRISKGKELLDVIENAEIPVIAMIKGVCFGGGLEIALACHIRVCSSNSLFAFPETGLGLIPGLGGTQRLAKLIHKPIAIQMLLCGDIITAQQAKVFKLVDYVADSKEIDSFTYELANKLTEGKSSEVVRFAMRSINNAGKIPVEKAMAEETRLFCLLAAKEAKKQQIEDSK